MNWSIAIKAMIFIILAVFASWPYFEKFKEYRLWKRWGIGFCIVALIVMGIYDIVDSDSQSKERDKKMNGKIDSLGKTQNNNFIELKQSLSSHLQEDQGNIAKALKHKKHKKRKV